LIVHFAKVGTKVRQQVVVAQLVFFTCGLKATEFVFFLRENIIFRQNAVDLTIITKFACIIFRDLFLISININEFGEHL
jgi:hypothetical protein